MNGRMELYDKISRILTEYEEGECSADELYSTLVEIQNKWETVVTAETE